MILLTPDKLHGYQQRAVNHQCSHAESMLWLGMGLGKTIITLTSIVHLLNSGFLRGVVIVAPIRVIRLVWRQEAARWEHTKNLRFSVVSGTRDQRTRALLRPADVYLVNYDVLGWLAETLETYFVKKERPLPFNGIVWDEISKMKNSTTDRVKSFRKIQPHFTWATGLTGTPASNGYKDLHGQFLVVDAGKRLGTSKTAFRTRFYKKVGPFKEVPYDDTESVIKGLIGDITLEMSAEEYNPLPDLIVNNIDVELPADIRSKYDQMEKEFFLMLDSGKSVEMFNQASLTNKCLAEGTEVLTSRGWERIERLTRSDKVWDGLEWVSISGIVCNGYKSVVECWGVKMTLDHKVLTVSGWKEAHEVINGQPGKGFDRAPLWIPDCDVQRGQQNHHGEISSRYLESSVRLWERSGLSGSQSHQQASSETQVLRVSSRRDNCAPRYDQDEAVDDLAKHEGTVLRSIRQGLVELRRSWDQGLRKMGRLFRVVLGGHGRSVPISFNHRTEGCERRLHPGKLSVGQSTAPGQQHSKQCEDTNTSWSDDDCSSGAEIRVQTHYSLQEEGSWVDRRDDSATRVYDIVNAGPRHRFTVRGVNGEVFIAHNCLQFSNGAVYPIPGMPLWEPIHDLKLDALEEIIDEAQGSPVLCSYAYRSDAERIMARFKDIDPINLTECKTEFALNDAMRRWKSGECRLMIGHSASMGHGVDSLQHKGHIIVWFGLNWSLDLYEQMNARIRRQGQGHPVVCHRILTRDTLDQAQALALDEKSQTQEGLKKAVREYRKQRGV